MTPSAFRNGAGLILAASMTSPAAAQVVNLSFEAPAIDRWNYPFNSTPGYRTEARIFSALGQEDAFPGYSFDQRDGQMLVGFDLAPGLPAGRGACRYRVTAAALTMTVSTDLAFRYDPTYDPWQSYLGGAADSNGRPVELYGVAFRAGWMACPIDPLTPSLTQFPCYYEGTPSNPGPPFGPGALPSKDTRYAYPTDYDGGAERDVSNNVRDQFDPAPFAIGTIDGLATGAFVPIDSEMRFTLNVADAEVQAYLRHAADTGLLRLMVTSLQPATAPGGGGPGTGSYASFYCKEIGIDGLAARLAISIRLIPAGDADASGTVDFADITAALTNWSLPGPDGDANCDGIVNFADVTEILTNWGASG